MAAVCGSGSASGTAMAGGFAVCGFAADPHSSSLQTPPASPEAACFRGRLDIGLKKPFFQAISRATFAFDGLLYAF
jgi:hypothetical protein